MSLARKSLRQRAADDPHLEVSRREADEILDIAWSNCLNDFELGPLWGELEKRYGLKSHPRQGQLNSRYYYLNEVVDALQRRQKGEIWQPPTQEDAEPYDPATFIEFDLDDDALVTARQVVDAFMLSLKYPHDFVRRLGVGPVEYRGREPIYRFGDVKTIWVERKFNEWE